MAVLAESKLVQLLVTGLTGLVLGVMLHAAIVVHTSEASTFRSGFLEVDDLPLDSSFFDGAVDAASARRLDGESDLPFIQNKTNRRCAPWDQGDRLFAKSDMDLPSCYAECERKDRCNHFSIALTGPNAGRCIGCKEGLLEVKKHYVFFTMQRSDQTSSFSCPDGLVTSVDLNTLVEGDRNYQVCIAKDSSDTPTCTDLRNQGQATASVTSCAASSSTSTSTSVTTTTASSSSTSTSTSTEYVFTPQDRTELKEAVNKWLLNKTAAAEEYGDISTWVTSLVTDMSDLFYGSYYFFGFDGDAEEEGLVINYFNDDISGWDVSRVTRMDGMFYQASVFNQDLSGWDVSKVTRMDGMFREARAFNADISGWDVGRVETMAQMFNWAESFNQPLGAWDVSKVVDMTRMLDSTSFNQNISGWNVANVQFMRGLLSRTPFNEDISGWNVSKVTDMSTLFSSGVFNQDISSWDVSRVTTMRSMFVRSAFTGDISGWDVSNVEDMRSMFFFNENFNGDLSSWDVSKATDMSAMFRGAVFNGDISAWNVGKVEKMTSMFVDAKAFNQDISGWDVSSVTNMDWMFKGADAFAAGDVDITIWTPTSLFRSPLQFLSSTSELCISGNWSNWGANEPQCY